MQEGVCSWCCSCRASKGVLAGLAGADADHLLERRDEDLAVADLARARGGFDRLDDAIDDRIVDGGLDLPFRQEVDDVLGAPIELRVSLLPAEALDFRHRDALHADGAQGFTHFVEFERLDDCGHHLHCPTSLMSDETSTTNAPRRGRARRAITWSC